MSTVIYENGGYLIVTAYSGGEVGIVVAIHAPNDQTTIPAAEMDKLAAEWFAYRERLEQTPGRLAYEAHQQHMKGEPEGAWGGSWNELDPVERAAWLAVAHRIIGVYGPNPKRGQ